MFNTTVRYQWSTFGLDVSQMQGCKADGVYFGIKCIVEMKGHAILDNVVLWLMMTV
jgi:hypothetical protein